MLKSMKRILLSAVFIALGSAAFAQQTDVSGTVKDEAGEAIIGASVTEEGTKNATVTDFDGNFRLKTAQGAKLKISYIGYKTATVNAGQSLVVTLHEDNNIMDELVVTGYTTQRRADLTGAVAVMDMDEPMSAANPNMLSSMQGKLAGVTIVDDAAPGGGSSTIRVRGMSTVNSNNSPLYIIDGSVASDTEFSMINAGDIESIEILKDAASQAIYGARASDGVILVTTKRGKAGESTVTYNGYVGVQTLHRNFDFYNADEYLALRREAVAHDMGVVDATTVPITTALADEVMEDVWKSGEFVDWEDLMFKKAALYHSHELSFRGGTDKLRAMASVGYFSQDGMMRFGSGYDRLSARVNLDYQVKKWLKLGANTSFGFSKRLIENGAFYQFITRSPLSQVYDENGDYTPYINSNKDTNPVYSALHDSHDQKSNNYRINAFADITPFKGFTYRFNISYYNRVNEEGHARDSYYPNGGGSTASITNATSTQLLIENSIRYDVPIRNGNHKLNITAVQSVDKSLSKNLGYSVENLPVDKTYNYIANGEVTGQERLYTANNLVSFMLRAQYNLMEKYLFNVAVRRDGSSRFGTDNKWGTFPSFAFAWRASQESFLKDVSWIDNLKLRASYGIVGNQNGIDNYTTLGIAQQMPGEFGDTYYMGYLPGMELPNKDLKWEQSATANIGLDFGFLDNRISGTVEWYNTRTTNLLVSRALNASLGYTSMLDNLGETRSSGFDINATFDIIRNQNVNWSITATASTFRNRIVKIDDTVDEDGNYVSQPGNNWIIGAPINIYYDYKADGVYQYDDFDVYSDRGTLYYELKPTVDTDGDGVADAVLQRNDVVEPGSVKLADVNGDGKINENDRVYLGNAFPRYTFGLNYAVSWKGIDLSIMFQGVLKRDMMLRGELVEPFHENYGYTMYTHQLDYWTPTNTDARWPRLTYTSAQSEQNNYGYCSDIQMFNASYLRLKDLQIGYTFPKKWMDKVGIEKLRIYFDAQNLFTVSGISFLDPESSEFGNSMNAGGANSGRNYPNLRYFGMGLDFTF